MKLKTILEQLITFLPLHTDFFNEIIAISSLTFSTGIVTAVTSSAHGQSNGDLVNIRGALERNSITSLTSINGIATAITVNNHNLTEGLQGSVNITGADQAEYNGDKTLLSVVDEKTFTYAITGSPVSPATGTIFLNENKAFGYNGLFIVTVLSTTSFTYNVARDLAIENGNPEVSLNPRIFTGIDIDRITKTYTEKPANNYVLYINLGQTLSSRDRDTRTDATYEYVKGSQDYRQHLISTVNLFVFASTTKTVNAGEVRDTFEDIRFALLKTLGGAFLDSGSSDINRRSLTYLDDDLEFYNGAFLVHRYTFETVFDITQDDIFEDTNNVVIQELEINYLNSFDEIVKTNTKQF